MNNPDCYQIIFVSNTNSFPFITLAMILDLLSVAGMHRSVFLDIIINLTKKYLYRLLMAIFDLEDTKKVIDRPTN